MLFRSTEQLLRREYEKLDRIKEAYTSGVDTLEEYKANKLKINRQIEKLEKLRPVPKPEPSYKDAYFYIRKTIEDFLRMAADPETSPKLLNDTLKTFVSKIVFSRTDNQIAIFYYV